VKQVSVDLLESFFIKFPDYCEIDILERNDMRIGRPVNERMVSLVLDAINSRRVVGIRPGNNHPGHLHDVKLEPRCIEA